MTQHTVGLMTDEAFLEHLGPPDHPECPARLEACAEALADAGLTGRFEAVSARPVTDEEARRVHTSAYLTDLARCRDQSGYLDPDTFHSPGSHEAAVLAAGGGVELTHRVLDDRLGADPQADRQGRTVPGRQRAADATVPQGLRQNRYGPDPSRVPCRDVAPIVPADSAIAYDPSSCGLAGIAGRASYGSAQLD